MTSRRRRRPTGAAHPEDPAELRRRLADAEDALRAVRAGEVDAVVVAGERGPQVFTLEGAEHVYRTLIESMNEGALILATDKTILYANRCFSRMVKSPLRQVIGGSFRRYLADDDRTSFRALLKRADRSGSKSQVELVAGDGSRLPAQVSIRTLPTRRFHRATVGMVVTDMTEARRSEEMLRALTHRVVRAQERERARVAVELHDHITQMLCALLLQSQALSDGLPDRAGPAKKEAIRLRDMLGRTADEVERISRGLRPGLLEVLGLAAVLRSTSAEFADRTGVKVDLDCGELTAPLPAEVELALLRLLQEALRNVERHAHARHVRVGLTQAGAFVELSVTDDGSGFDPQRRPTGRIRASGLGLLGMRERAAYVHGDFEVRSAPGAGTTILARVPLGGGGGGPRGAAVGSDRAEVAEDQDGR